MKDLKDNFAPGLRYSIASDDSTFIQENITDLRNTILIATFLVVLVILFFLQSYWGTIITSIAIPTSLAGGMAMIYAFGFSLNVLTMLAFILVIGIVVDDAIVVLESSYRHIEEGAERMAGTRVGTTEIAFAAIANSLSLAAVFIPVAFTQGMIGRFFYEFGVTVAVTVFVSTFTALTLTPVLCSQLLTASNGDGGWEQNAENILNVLERSYRATLNWALNYRWLVIVVALLAFGIGIMAVMSLDQEFAPSEDRGEFMISFETPEGSTLQATDKYAQNIEKTLSEVPEVRNFFLAIGLSQGGPGQVNSGISFIRLSHRTERERSHLEIMQSVREKLKQFPGGRAFVLEQSGPGGGNNAPLQMILQSQDLNLLAEHKNEILSWMRQQPEFVGVNSDLKMEKPEVSVRVDRDRASEMGITVANVSNTMRYLLGDPDVSEIERNAERYDVITEIANENGQVPSTLRDLYIRSTGGELVSLSNIVNIKETVGPSEVHHFNRLRSATLSASTPPDITTGEALNKLQAHLAETLPAGFKYTASGEAQDMQESFYYLTISLVFAIVFVYLVLAAQFESWLHPFTIMMTLPLATAGAYGALYLLDMTFSVFVFIGTIMLIGLVTKNGILLIDYANIFVERGHNVVEAAREAGRIRFRPVLMTAVSTILGMMPIALGYGAGGESRAPMGWTVAAGMFTASALTLIVIPVVYTLVADAVRWLTENSWKSLQTFLGLVLLAAGSWMSWTTYQLPIEGQDLLVFLLPVALLIFVALGAILRFPGTHLILYPSVILFVALGGVLRWKPEILSGYAQGLNPERSSLGLIAVGVIAMILLLVNRISWNE